MSPRSLLVKAPPSSVARTIPKFEPPKPVDGSAKVIFKSDLTAKLTHLKNLCSQLDTLVKNSDTSKTIRYVNGVSKLVGKNFRPLNQKKKFINRP